MDALGLSNSYPVLSKVSYRKRAMYANPRRSRRDICTALRTARRLQYIRWMVGGVVHHIADMRPPHTQRTVLRLITIHIIHAIVEKDKKSFKTQRMFANGARQHKLDYC